MSELTELEQWAAVMGEELLIDRLQQLRDAVVNRDPAGVALLRRECRGFLAALFWHNVVLQESRYECYLGDVDWICGEVGHV